MKLDCFCLPLGFDEEEVCSDCLGAEGFGEKPQTFLFNFTSFRERFSTWEIVAPFPLCLGQL